MLKIKINCSLFVLSNSPAGGHSGQQGLPRGRGLVLERWDVQPTSADSAPVRGRQRQHEAGPRRPEPVRQRHVGVAVQPTEWLPVQAGNEEGEELPEHLLEPPSVHHPRSAVGGTEVWVTRFHGVRLNVSTCVIFRTQAGGELPLRDGTEGLRLRPPGLHHSR